MELSPWMISLIEQYGNIALLFVSFISATILPFSSAAALIVGIGVGMPVWETLFFCSLGNSLGCAFNYWLGYFSGKPILNKLVKSKGGKKAKDWVEKYGNWSLWASWTPILGDPITIAAGVFRLNFALFASIVFSLRIAGYLLIALFFI